MTHTRIAHIQRLLEQYALDACLITSVPTITYLTGFSNFSLDEREAYLFITKDSQYILTDGRYSTAVKKTVKTFEFVEVASTKPFKVAFESLVQKHAVRVLGIEEDTVFVHEYKILQPLVSEMKHFPASSSRTIKEAEEIAAIGHACQLGDQAFAYILQKIQPNMTEKHIAFLLENFMREQGAEPSFASIVAFDEHAAVPHHQTGETKLGKTSLILLDFGVKIDNYCSDMTRTVFLGKATGEQKKVYQTVYDAQRLAIQQWNNIAMKQSKPVSAKALDDAARNHITSQGYPSIPHSLGHGIGLEVHESPTLSPVSKHVLGNGMVFSIEPGIYLPGNLGVRIEDLFVVEKSGLRQLTKSPNTLIEL